MRILDRYMTLRWIKPTLSALLVFLVLFLLIDFFGLTEDLLEHRPSINAILSYLIYRTGYAIFFLSPMALLVGGFWMTYEIRASNEWTICQLTGTSDADILRGPLLLMAVVTLLLIAVNCFYMPEISNRMETLDDYTLKNRTKSPPTYKNIHTNLPDGRTVRIGRFKPERGIIEDITISNRTGITINDRMDSPRGTFTSEKGWVLRNVSIRRITKSGEVSTSTRKRIVIPLAPPSVLRTVLKMDPRQNNLKPVQYSMADLRTSINYRQKRSMNTTTERILFHWKFGFPLANFVMGLLGMVVGLRSTAGKAGGVGLCLLLGLGYWIVFSFSISWGKIAEPFFDQLRILPYAFVYGPAGLALLVAFLFNSVFSEQA